jgi:peptidoglycan/xylan/chitin deacetylase (PgdA/CDA1 family)
MKATILTYHHVADPPEGHPGKNLFVLPENFSRQMKYLKEMNFNVISLNQVRKALLGEIKMPEKAAVITFDDGFEDNFTHAFPILKKFDLPATVFMVSEKITSLQEEKDNYLSKKQILEMTDSKITIASHAKSHPKLAKLSLEEAENEIVSSKKELEEMLGKDVDWFCYPYGSFSMDIVSLVKKAGYLGAASVIRDNVMTSGQLYYLPRVMVMHDTGMMKFKYYFTSLYHIIHARKNRKRWKNYL